MLNDGKFCQSGKKMSEQNKVNFFVQIKKDSCNIFSIPYNLIMMLLLNNNNNNNLIMKLRKTLNIFSIPCNYRKKLFKDW